MSGGFGRDYWEERYRDRTGHVSGPSPQLVAEVGHLTAGAALEAGCGEGANAVWLAKRGWMVTAVDIAVTALDRARELAASHGPDVAGRIEWVDADLTYMPPAPEHFDLVTAHYVHPAGPMDALVSRLADAVRPGGTLLIVGHDPADAHSSEHAGPDVSFRPGDLAAGLDAERWDVQVAETRVRNGLRHGIPMHDAVLRARRRP